MGNDNDIAKWIYAGLVTVCVTGVAALAIMRGTPIALTAGVGPVHVKMSSGAATVEPNNDRSKM